MDFRSRFSIVSIKGNTTVSNNRPDAVPEQMSRWRGHRGVSVNVQWFELQPFGSHYGDLGRNTEIGAAILGRDFSTFKNFNFTKRSYLQCGFECFKRANHPDLPIRSTQSQLTAPVNRRPDKVTVQEDNATVNYSRPERHGHNPSGTASD